MCVCVCVRLPVTSSDCILWDVVPCRLDGTGLEGCGFDPHHRQTDRQRDRQRDRQGASVCLPARVPLSSGVEPSTCRERAAGVFLLKRRFLPTDLLLSV